MEEYFKVFLSLLCYILIMPNLTILLGELTD